ncbi:MAG: hypothetical protein MR029_00110 [Clostridium sp.]|nr:hypothetical protein [Clostridium sp.]
MAIGNIGSNTYTSELAAKVKGTGTDKDVTASESATETSDVGVVYEPSKETTQTSAKKNAKVDSETIAKLKADADQRLSQLKGIVEQLITKQGKTSETVSIWSQFRQGVLDGTITVDEATAKQAQEDISEDGYWGVKQTSERILDFAKALTGGDSSKVEDIRTAIEKGFSEAAKLWGDELPEISQKTHDAVMKGLDEWAKQSTEE